MAREENLRPTRCSLLMLFCNLATIVNIQTVCRKNYFSCDLEVKAGPLKLSSKLVERCAVAKSRRVRSSAQSKSVKNSKSPAGGCLSFAASKELALAQPGLEKYQGEFVQLTEDEN
ncbi:unnamed protein product [Calicophoron daubneyi]|uniref:Uncharacterized protein n=1 Tax=Calicophoron daubneyi TaxID=300641 RepID=A0AAV2T1V8_CALDB